MSFIKFDVFSFSDIAIVGQNHLKKYGSIFKVNVGFETFLVSANPKLSEFIMSSTKIITKANDYKYLHNWLGDGLLTSTGVLSINVFQID